MKEIHKQVKMRKRSLWLQNPNSLWWLSTGRFLNFFLFSKCVGSPWISEGRAVLQLLQSRMKGKSPPKVLCSLKPLATIRAKIIAQIGGLQPNPVGRVFPCDTYGRRHGKETGLSCSLHAVSAFALSACRKPRLTCQMWAGSFLEPVPFPFREIGIYWGAGRAVSHWHCGCSDHHSHVPNKDIRV